MKYRDAAKKPETVPVLTSEKYYPRLTLDDKSSDLKMDDIVPLRARVCGIHKSDYGNSIEVEVTEIGIPDVTSRTKEPRNEADRDLDKMLKQ